MDLHLVAGLFAVVTSTISIISAAVTLGYVFAVIRTEVTHLKLECLKFQNHMENSRIHHNGEAFREFEKRIEGRIDTLSEQIREVKDYVEEIDGKLDRLKSGRAKPHAE